MKPTPTFHNPPQVSDGTLWSTSDVAKFLRCSERQVFNLRQQGLPTIQVGGMIRFDPHRVRGWLSGVAPSQQGYERASQLADIAADSDDDNAKCAAADLAREFLTTSP